MRNSPVNGDVDLDTGRSVCWHQMWTKKRDGLGVAGAVESGPKCGVQVDSEGNESY